MIELVDFETYLYISNHKFEIFVLDKKDFSNLFNKEYKVNNDFDNLSNLSKFLDENIYQIEKLVGSFVKNIILIIDNDENLNINISLKKKNYDNSIDQKYLISSLIELKDLFKENYQEQTIMHMIVVNYILDGKKYSSFTTGLNCDYFSLEVNFISLSNNLISICDEILKNYQIKITNYLCANYIKNFLDGDVGQLPKIAFKLKNGMNDNEIILVPKNIENKGFFEKFFQLFS